MGKPAPVDDDGGPLRGKRWRIEVGTVPAGGVRGHETANAEELAELAVRLDLEQCEQFDVDFQVRPLGGRRFLLKGKVAARIVQACTVTLEPLASHFDLPIDYEFWPADEISGGDESAAIDPFMADLPEPIRDGRIEIGRVAYEVLAVSIDPYPRKPDASFAWTDETAPERSGAFAELAKLRGKPAKPGT